MSTRAEPEPSVPDTPSPQEEIAALRSRVAALERELLEVSARANAAVAAAQDRSYWLDRWHVDLNTLMARPGAAQLRAVLRAMRAVVRFVRRVGRRAQG